jgi:hypothetical protein
MFAGILTYLETKRFYFFNDTFLIVKTLTAPKISTYIETDFLKTLSYGARKPR